MFYHEWMVKPRILSRASSQDINSLIGDHYLPSSSDGTYLPRKKWSKKEKIIVKLKNRFYYEWLSSSHFQLMLIKFKVEGSRFVIVIGWTLWPSAPFLKLRDLIGQFPLVWPLHCIENSERIVKTPEFPHMCSIHTIGIWLGENVFLSVPFTSDV